MENHEIGLFGNVWVRKNVLEKAGDVSQGHEHHFDHLSMLVSGSVQAELPQGTKTFESPSFIVIPKETTHRFTALTDNVVWYCVFAVRDMDGEVMEVFDEKHIVADETLRRFNTGAVPRGFWAPAIYDQEAKRLEEQTVNKE